MCPQEAGRVRFSRLFCLLSCSEISCFCNGTGFLGMASPELHSGISSKPWNKFPWLQIPQSSNPAHASPQLTPVMPLSHQGMKAPHHTPQPVNQTPSLPRDTATSMLCADMPVQPLHQHQVWRHSPARQLEEMKHSPAMRHKMSKPKESLHKLAVKKKREGGYKDPSPHCLCWWLKPLHSQ